MNPVGKHWQAIGLLVLANLLWASAGLISRQIQVTPGVEITFWRSFFTAIVLIIGIRIIKGKYVWKLIFDGPRELWFSGFCWSIMFTAFMIAMSLTTVANVLITIALGPLFTAVLGKIYKGKTVHLRTLMTILVASSGIVVMEYPAFKEGGSLGLGFIVALAVPIAASFNWTVLESVHDKGEVIDFLPAVFIGSILSCIYTLPFSIPFSISINDFVWLTGLGLFQLALPCTLVMYCAKYLIAAEISLLNLLETVFGIGLVWIFLNEIPDANVKIGGGMVIFSLLINEVRSFIDQRKLLPNI